MMHKSHNSLEHPQTLEGLQEVLCSIRHVLLHLQELTEKLQREAQTLVNIELRVGSSVGAKYATMLTTYRTNEVSLDALIA